MLFFDEADALFGKRSEVKDARDRYANIEVSYLLQRLESYDGLVVMATNFEKNIDEAFLRRIHARVEFAMPGPAERRAIWEHNLPADGARRGRRRRVARRRGSRCRAAGSATPPSTPRSWPPPPARRSRWRARSGASPASTASSVACCKPSDFGEFHHLVATGIDPDQAR